MQDTLIAKYVYDPICKSQPLVLRDNFRSQRKGEKAGCFPKNKKEYVKIKHNGKTMRLHRVVWIYFNGEIPDGCVIDHINSDHLDNRIENLQITTAGKNKRLGSTSKYKNNSSGMTGIVKCSATEKWKVSFRKNGKLYYFGVYEDLEQAKKICSIARAKYFPESRR